MTDTTELTREEVEALLAGATPGPWQVLEDGRSRVTLMHVETAEGCPAGIGLPVTSIPRKREPDADLIAAAPTLARQLLAMMDELAEARATLAAERGEAEGAPSEGWDFDDGENEWLRVDCEGAGYAWAFHLAPGRWQWDVLICGNEWSGEQPTARAAMKVADLAVAATRSTTKQSR